MAVLDPRQLYQGSYVTAPVHVRLAVGSVNRRLWGKLPVVGREPGAEMPPAPTCGTLQLLASSHTASGGTWGERFDLHVSLCSSACEPQVSPEQPLLVLSGQNRSETTTGEGGAVKLRLWPVTGGTIASSHCQPT